MKEKTGKKREITPRHLFYIVIAVCMLLICATYIWGNTNPLTDLTAKAVIPMQTGLNEIGSSLADRLERYRTLELAQQENSLLKEELAVLRTENSRLQEEQYELERLRELLHLREAYSQYTMIGARVIQKDSGNWFQGFLIDKGEEDGIQVGCNVVAGGAEGGLVGIVTDAGSHYARVRSIIDDASNVGGMVLTDGESIYCLASGNLVRLTEEGVIDLAYIPKDALVEDGAKIMTSNLSSDYLPDILIGYAENVSVDSDNLQQSGDLLPAVRFNDLREVLVILDLKETEGK